MQVFGLPRHVIRNGRAASRVLDAKTPDIDAARKRDAVARRRRAMAQGLGSGGGDGRRFPRQPLAGRSARRHAPEYPSDNSRGAHPSGRPRHTAVARLSRSSLRLCQAGFAPTGRRAAGF